MIKLDGFYENCLQNRNFSSGNRVICVIVHVLGGKSAKKLCPILHIAIYKIFSLKKFQNGSGG